jgi:zinc protease
MYTEEPPQEGERRVTVRRAGNDMVGIAHKIPHALHEDMPALMVLAAVLDAGKTSRLYRALVDTGLATEASTYCFELRDPSLFMTYTALTPKTSHAKAEAAIRKTYQELMETSVSAAELNRARRLLRTQIAQRRDGPYQLLTIINESIATGDWTHFITLDRALMNVTASDIRRTARKYLLDDQATIGHFVNTAL